MRRLRPPRRQPRPCCSGWSSAPSRWSAWPTATSPGDYQLSGTFPSAGEGLHPGSAVVFRGVQVGRVSTISLYGQPGAGDRPHRALLQGAGHGHRDHRAGEPLRGRAGRHLHAARELRRRVRTWPPGATFARADSSDELGDLFAAATPLLNEVNTNNLSTVLGELAQASQGEGPKIAASISAGTQLAGLLDRTLNAQILALDSFAKFAQAMAPAAADLNNLNARDQRRAARVQRRRGRLRAPPQHADPVLQPAGLAAGRRTTPTSPPSSPRATTSPGSCWPSRATSARSSTAPTTTSRRSPRAHRA